MRELDSDFHGDGDTRVRKVARLATLQRLRDEALANDRPRMLATITRMIEAEMNSLQGSRDRDRDAEPQV
jgi:hypothetical protein